MSEKPDETQWKAVTDDFAVMGQLQPEDIDALAAAGFGAIICNRPDGEAPDEPQFDAIGEAARNAGLQARYIPVSNQVGLTPENVADMKAALAELPKPVLAYCRSGARSAKLYEAAQG
ncbi:MAG: TIGR01244 family sulfur transferase [Roseitalea porphyridii]|uniref:TIGR01244 family sulfur transferase n=1 Tax=Roseitalea porphyridii TaxID=1852022 RepID=UPI0032D9721B